MQHAFTRLRYVEWLDITIAFHGNFSNLTLYVKK